MYDVLGYYMNRSSVAFCDFTMGRGQNSIDFAFSASCLQGACGKQAKQRWEFVMSSH